MQKHGKVQNLRCRDWAKVVSPPCEAHKGEMKEGVRGAGVSGHARPSHIFIMLQRAHTLHDLRNQSLGVSL